MAKKLFKPLLSAQLVFRDNFLLKNKKYTRIVKFLLKVKVRSLPFSSLSNLKTEKRWEKTMVKSKCESEILAILDFVNEVEFLKN